MVHSCLWMSTTEADKGCHCWCLVLQPDRETLEASYEPLMGIFEGSALLAPQARMPVFQGLAVVVGSIFFIKSPCVNKCFTITFKSKHVQSGCSVNTSWGAITCWPPTCGIWKLYLEQGDKWLRECFMALALQWYFGAKSPKQANRILLKMVSIPVAINPSNSLSWISQTVKCSHTYVISFDTYSYEVGREEQFSLSRWRKGLSEIFRSHGLWRVAKQGISGSPSAESGALLLFSKESQTAGSCSTLHISILPEMAPPQGMDQSPDLLSPRCSGSFGPDGKVCIGQETWWASRPAVRIKAQLQCTRPCFHNVPPVLKILWTSQPLYCWSTEKVHLSFLWTPWKWTELPSSRRSSC